MIKSEEMCIGSCGSDCDSRCSLYEKNRYVLTCDKCKTNTDVLWKIGKKQFCEDCLDNMFPTVEKKCEECGDEYVVYDVNGKYLCLDCIEEYFERITDDE